MQIGPRSSKLYNFQKIHLIFKHPVGAGVVVVLWEEEWPEEEVEDAGLVTMSLYL